MSVKFDESQQAFIDSDEYPYFCLAPAGSGKTSSLLGKAHKLAMDEKRDGNILILCFNKGIKDEIDTKLKSSRLNLLGVEASTLHGLGKSFIEKALNPDRKLIKCFSNYQNKHLYFGWIRNADRKKYGSYPGLLNKFLDSLKLNGPSDIEDAGINSKINLLATQMLTSECVIHPPLEFDVTLSKYFNSVKMEIFQLLQTAHKTKSDPTMSEKYAQVLAEKFLNKIEATRKASDFWKFFVKNFYHDNFVQFVHNTITEFIFRKDLFGRFADDDLDYAPKAVPLFVAFVDGLLPHDIDYLTYSECLRDELGAIAITDILNQIQKWNELDFDSMLSVGLYAMMKLKHNYYAVFSDEAQDYNLLYWYMTYEAFPKYLIKDKEKRVVYVGDTLQAINRWNAASPERFVTLANNHAKSRLVYSYRCPQAIVEKAIEIKEQSLVKVDIADDRFISAAPLENQPGIYDKIEAIDASQLEAFLESRGFKIEEVAILGRTNHDLMPWQLWAILKNIPVKELLVTQVDLKTENVKTLLCLVALSSGQDNYEIASGVLDILKGPGTADAFLEHWEACDPDYQDELLLKYFTTLNLKEEDELSPDEIRMIAMGKGAINTIRKWYSSNQFSLRSDFKNYITKKKLEIETEATGIILSTVHRMKGKEANVILIQSNSWANISGNALKSGSVSRIEEETCLAYVAITRAKKATFAVGNTNHPSC